MKKISEFLLDFLFPASKKAARIEKMTASDFRKEIGVGDAMGARGDKDIHPLFEYRHPLVREAIWQIKYKGNRKITKLLSEILYEEIVAEIEDRALFENFKNPLLIPVPTSKKRLQKRGFNQMELLGGELKSLDENRTFEFSPGILIKIKDTLPQTLLKDRRLRLGNLVGCFAVTDAQKIKNRNIILIDDVLTTGATLAEAKRALINAGARRVIAFTLAH
ncbi:MAG: phosphoribosyltransferase family protein [Candidatus Taylorbacteria bacterium]